MNKKLVTMFHHAKSDVYDLENGCRQSHNDLRTASKGSPFPDQNQTRTFRVRLKGPSAHHR